MKKNLFIIILFIANFCYSQNEIKEREPFVLKLAVDNEQFYQMDIPKSKFFVKENIIQIYPTEKLNVEVEIKNDTIYSMKVVDKIVEPKRTIQIEFLQNVKDKKPEGMMLKVTNPFDRKLNYNAMMYIVGHNKWLSTSIIPILPNLVNYETWNDVIITLVLEKWRFEK
ncbi:hypothetical protein DMB65_21305 [Flavobacterium cheongpyeongense]|uniref:Uncharacterized protein n=1 Tax=Flavobacterium cheongpyeongense TaxID=2212651 RepID=A0A2V4BXN5_9FLAO|nr:hypothetical protein [Flavobacterium cheongpyeongense]PXY38754.1 hypothetical protein DMB65_21305 [Flavobacterium cheongpyeongense]